MFSSLSTRLTQGLLGAFLLAGIFALTPDANAQGAPTQGPNTAAETSLDTAKVAAEVRRILETTPHDVVLRESFGDLVAEGQLTRREAAQFVRLTTAPNPQALQRAMDRLKQSDNGVLKGLVAALETSVGSYTDEVHSTEFVGNGTTEPAANDQASTAGGSSTYWQDVFKTLLAGVGTGAALGTVAEPGGGTVFGAVIGGGMAVIAIGMDAANDLPDDGGDKEEDDKSDEDDSGGDEEPTGH